MHFVFARWTCGVNESSRSHEGIWPISIVARRRNACRAGSFRRDPQKLAAWPRARFGFDASRGGAPCRTAGDGGPVRRHRLAIRLDEVMVCAAAGQHHPTGKRSAFRLDRTGDRPMRDRSRAQRRDLVFPGDTGGGGRRRSASMDAEVTRHDRRVRCVARLPGHAGWTRGRFAAAGAASVQFLDPRSVHHPDLQMEAGARGAQIRHPGCERDREVQARAGNAHRRRDPVGGWGDDHARGRYLLLDRRAAARLTARRNASLEAIGAAIADEDTPTMDAILSIVAASLWMMSTMGDICNCALSTITSTTLADFTHAAV